MADLIILVPSRGRPRNVTRLREACDRTCRADTRLHFGFDNDDPHLTENLLMAGGAQFTTSDRMGLTAWTNALAALNMRTPALASLGDDMVPVTPGWDDLLLSACGAAGMAYPDDRRRDDIPEAIVMTTNIVSALGWMAPPSMDHWFIDSAWADIGNGARCLAYLPHVTVEHRHPNVPGGDKPDQTNWDASPRFAADMAAYQKWRIAGDGMRSDIAKVRAVCR